MLDTTIGKVSEPFKSSFGWHILRVEDARDQDIGAMLQANQARQVIQGRKYEEELSKWILEIRSESFIDIKDEAYALDEEV
jgi:peptidyl-prolyl cis-trans isomerase SurA